MSAHATLATAQRVLWQIRHDPRTIALLLVVPTALLTLLYFVFEGQPHTFQKIGAPLCGLFPFIVMFLVASIAMLRERTTGTLERLMTLPLSKTDVLFGYGLAFGALAALQAVIICTVGFLVLGLEAAHGAWLVGLLAVANAILGMALGLFVSAFAQTEFQAVQFMPAFVPSPDAALRPVRAPRPDGRLASRDLLADASDLRLRRVGPCDSTRSARRRDGSRCDRRCRLHDRCSRPGSTNTAATDPLTGSPLGADGPRGKSAVAPDAALRRCKLLAQMR